MTPSPPTISPYARVDEQREYARVLRIGSRVSFAVLVATFLAYVSGVVPPLVPIDELPRYWSLRTADYLNARQLGNGWSWLRLVGFGDFLSFVGVAMLAALTIACYARILPILLRKRDVAYAFVVAAEIAILVLAASGLLTAGH